MSVVLITGTSSGFGRLAAQTLARAGHRCTRHAGGRARNAAAAGELRALAEPSSSSCTWCSSTRATRRRSTPP
jgi:NAD(P)-dependent dehydrogenase (short-subunit alcohol dehydrogenase family)